jgi:hypothetical protein
MSVTAVGRDAEAAKMAEFLETLPHGPRILLIEGEVLAATRKSRCAAS